MPLDALNFLRSSFLGPYLLKDSVTDISYNGEDLYYVDNLEGRKKAETSPSPEEVLSFLKQIANFTEKSFHLAEPLLDVSLGPYRLNAVHPSLSRRGERKVPSFSLRIASKDSRIKKDPDFLEPEAKTILLSLLKERRSLLIGGATGTGKTELQKYLLSLLEPNTRIIVLDNVEELSTLEEEALDMTTWLTDIAPRLSLSELIRNALRHHPDYLIVAEARGKEMSDALFAAGSGHPLIMTLHASSLEAMPLRVLRLARMGEEAAREDLLMEEISNLLSHYLFLEKKIDEEGKIRRYLKAIGELEKDGKMRLLHERKER